MSYSRKWKPSAAQRREFAQKMQDPKEKASYYARKEERAAKRRASSNYDYATAGGSYVPTSQQHDAAMEMCASGQCTDEQLDAANQVAGAYACNMKVPHDAIHIVNKYRRSRKNQGS